MDEQIENNDWDNMLLMCLLLRLLLMMKFFIDITIHNQ
jgi:hypothetical protein